MKTIIAKVHLYATAEGGKQSPIRGDFRCPLFFLDVPELGEAGYECRLLMAQTGRSISPGETVDAVPIAFLSPGRVLPYVRVGTRFKLWEAGDFGEGEVTSLDGSGFGSGGSF